MTSAAGKVAGPVMVRAGSRVTVKPEEFGLPTASVTVTVKGKVPIARTVPEILPLLDPMLSPAGSPVAVKV